MRGLIRQEIVRYGELPRNILGRAATSSLETETELDLPPEVQAHSAVQWLLTNTAERS